MFGTSIFGILVRRSVHLSEGPDYWTLANEWMSLMILWDEFTSLFGSCSWPSSLSPPSVGTQLSTKYGRLHPMTHVQVCYADLLRTFTIAMVQTRETKKLKYTPSGFIQLDSYDCYLWHPLFFLQNFNIFLIKLIILYCIMWLTLICHAGVFIVYCMIILHQAQCDCFLMSCNLFWL